MRSQVLKLLLKLLKKAAQNAQTSLLKLPTGLKAPGSVSKRHEKFEHGSRKFVQRSLSRANPHITPTAPLRPLLNLGASQSGFA